MKNVPRVEVPPNVVTKDTSNIYESSASHDVGSAARTRPDRTVADISLLPKGCQPGDSGYIVGSTPLHRRRYRCDENGGWIAEWIKGGPSGGIDCEAVPFECELNYEAVRKYVGYPFSQPHGIPLANEAGKIDPTWLPAVAPATPQKQRTILGWTGDTYVAASRTAYVTFGSMGIGGSTNRVFAMPVAGRFTRLMVRTRGSQPTTGTLQFFLAQGGSALKGPAVIIPAGGPAGVYVMDGSLETAEHDLIQIQINNAATANSAYISSITALFEF